MKSLYSVRHLGMVLVICGVVLGVQGCGGGGPPLNMSQATHDCVTKDELLQRLNQLELAKELGGHIWDDSRNYLFELPFVRELYQHPEMHVDSARAVLLDPNVPTNLKLHAIRLLQCLDLVRYIDLGREVLEAVKNGDTECVVLESMVDPWPEWGTRIALAYEDPVVAGFLEDVLVVGSLNPETRRLFEETADGTRAEFLEYYCAEGRECPFLQCR